MTIKFWSSAVLLSVFLCLTQFSGFSQQAEGTIPLDPEIRHGKLDNGFTYFIKKNNTPADKVHLRLVVKAGAIYEDADQLELAHLLEHVAFNGTKNYPNNKLMEYFNSIGFVPGANWSAATGFDVTDYRLDIPSDNPKVLANCLQVLRDWAGDMQLDPKEIDDERGVVLGEFRSKSNPSWEMDILVKSRLFNHPRYSADEKEKHDKSINTFKTEALQRFYREWYRPDLEAIIIVGDINVEDVENKIKALFADLKMPDHPRKAEDFASRYAVELKNRNQLISIKDKNLQETTVRIYQQRKAGLRCIKNIADMKLSIIDELYNNMVGSRFTLLMLQNDQLFDNVNHQIQRNEFSSLPQIDVLSTMITFKKNQPIQAGIKSVIAELNRLAITGFLPEELAEATNTCKENIRNQSTDPTNVSIVEKCHKYFIYGEAAPSFEEELRLKMELLDRITLQEVNDIARSWINDTQNMAVVTLSPSETKIPDQSTVFGWIASAKKVKLPPYRQPELITGNFINEEELPKVNKKIAIQRSSFDDELGIRDITLVNGIRLILKGYQSNGDDPRDIKMTGLRSGGLSNYSGEDLVNASQMSFINSNVITRKYDQSQIKNFMFEKGLKLEMNLNRSTATIDGSCKVNNLETLLQLLYLRVTSPVKDSLAFEKTKKYWKEMLTQKTNRNRVNFRDSVDSYLFKNNTYRFDYSSEKEISKLNLDRIYEIYQNEFGDISEFTILLTGNFNEDKALDLFVKYFAGFETKKKKQILDSNKPLQFNGPQERTFSGGGNPGADVQLFLPGSYEYSIKNYLILQILNNAIATRMRDRLREKEGGTYDVSTQCRQGGDLKNAYAFSIAFECESNNVDHMINAAIEEFKKLKNEGLDDKIFEQAKERLKQKVQTDLATGGNWHQYLTEQYMTNRNVDEILKQSSILDLISLDMINVAAKKYLVEENMMRFVLLPMSAKTVK